jgi:hypothetical protein
MRLIGIGSTRKAIFTWRRRAVQLALALAGTGLMTAIAAAAIGAHQPINTEKAMAAAIVAQQIADGTTPIPTSAPVIVPQAAAPAPDSPGDTQARHEILNETDKIEGNMHSTISHTENLRTEAYKQKDMIRLGAITTKLDDMKQIMVIAEPAIAAIRVPKQDLFVMRAKLSTIRQGWDRMREDLQAAESAEGDSTNSVTSGIGPENSESNNSTGKADPSDVGSPNTDQIGVLGERPANASPSQ